jgi:hypothetical protein
MVEWSKRTAAAKLGSLAGQHIRVRQHQVFQGLMWQCSATSSISKFKRSRIGRKIGRNLALDMAGFDVDQARLVGLASENILDGKTHQLSTTAVQQSICYELTHNFHPEIISSS